MNCRIRLATLTAVIALMSGQELLACGDKFLAAGRGTRYQRPKNARAASILIYADPTSNVPALAGARVQSMLKQQGHRSTTATTFEQLASIVKAGHFDVILAASSVASRIEQLFAGSSDAAVVVAFDSPPKASRVIEAIDRAVERRDDTIRRNRSRS